MSDTITKWHEMQEAKKYSQTATMEGKFIYESPDGGKTVTKRPFDGDIKDRVIIQHPESEYAELKKEAYTLLCNTDERVIRIAMKILDIGE